MTPADLFHTVVAIGCAASSLYLCLASVAAHQKGDTTFALISFAFAVPPMAAAFILGDVL